MPTILHHLTHSISMRFSSERAIGFMTNADICLMTITPVSRHRRDAITRRTMRIASFVVRDTYGPVPEYLRHGCGSKRQSVHVCTRCEAMRRDVQLERYHLICIEPHTVLDRLLNVTRDDTRAAFVVSSENVVMACSLPLGSVLESRAQCAHARIDLYRSPIHVDRITGRDHA
jgi:hypothetical protein